MSTELKSLSSESSKTVSVTAFAGGEKRGRCLQLTQTTTGRCARRKGGDTADFFDYVQLDKDQVLELSKQCADFLAKNY